MNTEEEQDDRAASVPIVTRSEKPGHFSLPMECNTKHTAPSMGLFCQKVGSQPNGASINSSSQKGSRGEKYLNDNNEANRRMRDIL